ncbi:hypothetical protein BGW42_002528 [Actinomortierella wolfii]|nr:hypothetical protein BGW42_002528 [Actinomortierella wolfii]
MNALVNYSDDDSDSEQEQPKVAAATNSGSTAPTGGQEEENDEDDDIMAKLKELQDFAAMVGSDDDDSSAVPPPPPPPPLPQLSDGKDNTTQDPVPQSSTSTKDDQNQKLDQEEKDRLFATFMDEINAIPTTTLVQTHPPPPPPTPPRSNLDDVPPPPPPPPDTVDTPSVSWVAINLPGTETPQNVYNRLHNLSLLPGTAIDQKDTERRLIEFAIRILDWEQGGLRPGYFLGEERAKKIEEFARMSKEALTDELLSALPPFGGVVGAMLKHIQELEALAAPEGWQAVWDASEEAYGFRHWRTDTFSSVYPSKELIQALDPITPSTRSATHGTQRKYPSTKSCLTMSTKPPSVASIPTVVESPTSPATTQAGTPITSPVTTDSASTFSTSTPTPPPSSGTVIKKKAKRKAGEAIGDEDNSLADAHIHPSRRAIVAGASGAGASPNIASSTSSRMPKKVASLLQKWNEKSMNVSESESEDEQPTPSVAAPSGANSEQLGGDWRERRLHRK